MTETTTVELNGTEFSRRGKPSTFILVKSDNEAKVRDAISAKSDDFKLLPSRRKRSDGNDGGDDTELVDVNVKFTRSINTGSTDDNPDKTSGVEELINLVGEGKIYFLLHSVLHSILHLTSICYI